MGKRIISALLVLVMLAGMLPVSALAAGTIVASGTQGWNLTWTLDSEGTLTLSGVGELRSTGTYGSWADHADSIVKVIIENGITGIGERVFEGFTTLTCVTIPASVTSIGEGAFVNCCGLTSITIPDSVTSIGDSAFNGCTGLTSITIPNGLKSIGNKTFSRCGMTSISIPDSVTSIGDSAFSQCAELTSVSIPNSVTSIGDSAFSQCGKLTNVTIPEAVTSIGSSVFADCVSLTHIVLPDGVTDIGDNLFYRCGNLTSVVAPDTVKSIGSYAFYDCKNLTDFAIPDSVRSIGEHAFENCSSLTSIKIPDGVTSVENHTFCLCENAESIDIPDSVKSIGEYAFYGCYKLTSIHIPDGVTSIGQSAFTNCQSLTSIEMPDTAKDIELGFWGCSSLRSIEIPDGVTEIVPSAFRDCYSLTSVKIPDSVTSIGVYAFEGCHSLTSINIPDGVTSIGERAFRNCQSLTSIRIPDGVTKIGERTFDQCSSLESVELPDSVTEIDNYAFCACINLKSIRLPAGISKISPGAFYICQSLTSVDIPDGVTSIGEYAFFHCIGLTSVTIPEGVTSLGDSVFEGCTGLEELGFLGDAPAFGNQVFSAVNATAYYPGNNPTWTEEVRQNYGGNLTWKSDQAYLTPNEKGEIYFDSFYQLKRIAATNFDVMVNAKYVGKNPLVISEDLTIPYYMILDLSGCKKVTVPENVTFTVRCQLLVDNLEVNGTMFTQSVFNVGSALAVNGALTAFEIRANSDTVISGRENISFYNESGKLYRHYSIYTEQELRAAVADAEASFDDREVFVLYINPKQALYLTNPLKIPANCQVQLNGAGMNIQKGATLTVNCEFMGVYASLTVEGMLKNNSRIEYFADYGGKMSFAGNRAYNGKGLIQIFGEALDEPGDAVSGLDMSHFHVERKEGSWQPYWELKLDHGARLEDIVHDEHKTHKEKVDDVRDMDAEELKHSMEKDKHVRDMIEKLENDAAGGKAGKKVRHEVPGIDHEGISILGANLNSKEDDSLDVTLVIDKVEQERQITGNYDTSTAVQFSMTLDNVKDTKNLDVPVVVTIPVPAGIAADKVVVLHYHDDGTYDVINPEVTILGGKTYATFILTSFSDFAILEKLAALLGDVDLNEGVDVDDVLALLWYVLFPDMYPIGDVTADFDHNGSVDVDDVLTLLWYVLFPDMYPLTPPEPVKPVMGTVTVDKLNVRTEPSTSSYPIVKQLDINTRVEILEQQEVYGTIWGRIAEGWIPMNYVQLDAE